MRRALGLPLLGLPLLGLLLAGLSFPSAAPAQTVQRVAQRPPPLRPQVGCQIYRGTLRGNDPSVQIELRLCPRAGAEPAGSEPGLEVEGTLRWSSLRSGWNTRALSGAWSADRQHLHMRDLRITEDRPQPGWRFCVVDRYDLDRSPDGGLRGDYRAEACDDTAQLSLMPVAQSVAHDAQGGPVAGEPSDPEPPQAPEGAPSAGEERGLLSFAGCAASVSGDGPSPRGVWLAAIALLGLLGLRQRALGRARGRSREADR